MPIVYYYRFWLSDSDMIRQDCPLLSKNWPWKDGKWSVLSKFNSARYKSAKNIGDNSAGYAFSVTNNKLQNLELRFGQFLTFRAGQEKSSRLSNYILKLYFLKLLFSRGQRDFCHFLWNSLWTFFFNFCLLILFQLCDATLISVEAGGVQWAREGPSQRGDWSSTSRGISTWAYITYEYQLLALKLKVKKRKAQKLKNKIKFSKPIDNFWKTDKKISLERSSQATKTEENRRF